MLRGAGVGPVDLHRLRMVVALLGLGALVVAGALLVVAGVQRNDRIDDLKDHGVRVEVSVSGCTGLLGGSGSNPVGYVCHGSFVLDGRRYGDVLPDASFHARGAVVAEETPADDPGPLATPASVREDTASATVFILPAALIGAALAVAVLWAVAVRRRRPAG